MKRLLIIAVLFTLLVGCAGDPAYVNIETQPIEVTVNNTPLDVNIAGVDNASEIRILGQADGTFKVPIVDVVTQSLVTIDYEHHELHEGDAYTVADTVACDTTNVTWQILTPAGTKYSHMTFLLTSTGEATYRVTEGSDRDDGVALMEVNRRRVGTPNVAGTVVTRTPTGGTTDGATILFLMRSGSTNIASKNIEGSEARATSEWVLKPSTKYMVNVETYASVFVTMKLDWYEHTDRSP